MSSFLLSFLTTFVSPRKPIRAVPKWDNKLGYFHATYARKCFQLTKESNVNFFETQGTGHLVGRQFSVVTDEPIFGKFQIVMEGNNEVDIDGAQRRMDYLGTEDSFTFSWGFNKTFTGIRSGMPYIKKNKPSQLSIYRFHDHMPIRFTKSLRWSINWQYEWPFTGMPKWRKAVEKGNCWVDYATVFYWYEKRPGVYKHQPLRTLKERQKPMLRPNKQNKS